MRALLATIGLCLAPALVAVADDRPEALLRFQRHREALKTGLIEWTQENPELRDLPLEKDAVRAPTTHQMVARMAGDELISENHSALPRSMDLREETNTDFMLRDSRGIWKCDEDGPYAELYTGEFSWFMEDPRTIGAAAGPTALSLHDSLWKQFGNPQVTPSYREYEQDGYHVVEVSKSGGVQRWWIDAQRGWTPVVTEFYNKNGELWARSESTLRQYGDVWFPETVKVYEGRYKSGKEPASILHITKAIFNDPSLPEHLTPQDIGVDAGMSIRVMSKPGQMPVARYWDGKELLDQDQWKERVKARTWTEAPRLKQRYERLREASETRAKEKDPAAANRTRIQFQELTGWEAYTHQFIRQYQLDDEQRQKALSILSDCEKQADAYGAAHRADFEALEKDLTALKDSKQTDEQKDQIKSKRRQLTAPLDDIFEQQLKPRLDKLPTAAQRTAFEKSRRESSQQNEEREKEIQADQRRREKSSERP